MDYRYGRKANGIRRELQKKIYDWTATIDDANLAQAVRRDTIVTGGSIASMLLGEPVNDYDVYFRTKETAIAVAEYYVDKFNTANGDCADSRKPVVKTDTIKNIRGEYEERVLVHIESAGVAAESTYEHDYFDPDNDDRSTEDILMESDGEKYRPVFMSANAITLSGKMQLIVRFFGDPKEIHRSYDFVHAMNYYDFGANELVLHPEALEALLSRSLVYKGSLYPVASIFRVKKFLQRGWRITAGQLLKIMWQISELDLKNPDVIAEQLQGVDMAYMHMLISALKDVDMNTVDSTYVARLIDRIFD